MKKTGLIILLISLFMMFAACAQKDETETTVVSGETTAFTVETTTGISTTFPESTTVYIAEMTTEEPVTEGITEVSGNSETFDVTEEAAKMCSVEINCITVLENQDKLKDKVKEKIPSDGVIVEKCIFKIDDGDTALDILLKVCEESGTEVSYVDMPMFNSCYIEGINGIFEKDCGSASGWMYSVNGEFPQVGANAYTVSEGDEISFVYTCDGGMDIGGI